MKILEDMKACCGCHACANICGASAIIMERDPEGFLYPQIHDEICLNCGACKKVCPVLNTRSNPWDVRVYACKSRDEATRAKSSSGGIFTLLAEDVLARGGVVFGVAFNEQMEAVHIPVERKEDLGRLQGSKYVQSTVGRAFRQVREFLEQGRYVLFTGTPCQIGGLRSYLRKSYEKLLCADVICHGVPSPLVFEKYLQFLEQSTGRRVMDFQFRNKVLGWPNIKGRAYLEGGSWYVEPRNFYFNGFCSNLYLRPACHQCRFRLDNESSDLTLADYWRVQEKFPQLDQENGISMVISHNITGDAALKALDGRIEILESDLNDAIRVNQTIIKSVPPHPKRAAFFQRIERLPIPRLIAECLREPILERIKRKCKGAFVRIRKIF